jgi:uncharacterized protein YdiU (UPF0061 family)
VLGPLKSERREAWQKWLALYRGALRADGVPDEERRAIQNSVNPAYIPRNHVLLKVIAGVEEGDTSEVGLTNRNLKIVDGDDETTSSKGHSEETQ